MTKSKIAINWKFLSLGLMHLCLAFTLSTMLLDKIRAFSESARTQEAALADLLISEAASSGGDGFWKYRFTTQELTELDHKLRSTNISTDCQSYRSHSGEFKIVCKTFSQQ